MRKFVNRLRRSVIPAIVLLAASGGVVVVASMQGEKDTPRAAEPPPVNVEVLAIRPLPEVVDSFILPGVVEPNRVVRVAAEVAGRIEQISCREGQTCRKGDRLVYLNTDLLQAEYDQAKAQAEFDARDYERMIEAGKHNAATVSEIDQARAKSEAGRAACEAARARLDRAVIAAPIDGVLNRIPVEQGEYVAPGKEVGEIVDIDVAKVVVQVPERDVHYVQLGQQATVLVESLDSKKLSGKVAYIGELADEQTRTTRVEVEIENRDRSLRSGQIVRVELTRRVLKDVIMVPLLAVIPLENGRIVYVANGDKADRRDVELGILRGKKVGVLSGLKEGDQLIVAGHRFVAQDQSIRVVKVMEEMP